MPVQFYRHISLCDPLNFLYLALKFLSPSRY